jgi:CHAP domain
MQARATGCRIVIILSVLGLSTLVAAPPAIAAHHYRSRREAFARTGHHMYRAVWHGISCVPFAREESGIDLPGNAWEWWGNAAGVYARGSVPQLDSVLAFRSNPRMRLGHVAVVTRIVNPREVEVDQANWASRGAISRGVTVVDVSEENDWSAVRVEMGDGDDFGAVYPTYGFIYDEEDTGTMLASTAPPEPALALNPAPGDLRTVAERDDEVAELPGPAPTGWYHHYHLRHVLRVSLAGHHWRRPKR